jgi:hypothetical protein
VSRLIGFDIRRRAEDYLQVRWAHETRALYLLNTEIEWPLSVDDSVWPTVFRYRHDISELYPARTTAVDPGYEVCGLWSDLLLMRQMYEKFRLSSSSGIEVAIELIAGPELSSDQFGSPLLDKSVVPVVAPSKVPSGSSLLGYDVADCWLYSGLSNCGYSAEEAGGLRLEWSNKLNDHGLFGDIDDAARFRVVSDERVPEHAPFWVYGLYKLS